MRLCAEGGREGLDGGVVMMVPESLLAFVDEVK
jgi:hypothetical protein